LNDAQNVDGEFAEAEPGSVATKVRPKRRFSYWLTSVWRKESSDGTPQEKSERWCAGRNCSTSRSAMVFLE